MRLMVMLRKMIEVYLLHRCDCGIVSYLNEICWNTKPETTDCGMVE